MDTNDYLKNMFYFSAIIGIAIIVISMVMSKPVKEGMSGFGVITGLAYNNPAVVCSPGNSAGSSSPFCTNVGSVNI